MTKEEIQIEQERTKLALLKEELSQKTNSKNNREVFNSVNVTILVALIGFLGTTIISLVNSFEEKDLKQREFEYELIKKSLEQPTLEQRVDLLKFINKIKLIKDKQISISLDSLLENPENIPSISSNVTLGNDPIVVDKEFKNSNNRLSISALEAAKKYIGTKEIDLETIKKFNRGGNNPFWSCSFVCWCFSQNSKGEAPFKFTFAWQFLKSEFVSKKVFKTDFKLIKPGDIYFIQRQNGIVSHGGIVEKVELNQIQGIEGNINNEVARRTRKFEQLNGFVNIQD